MKFFRILFFIGLALTPFSACTQDTTQNAPPAWLQCQDDNDCVVIWSGCADIALNKNDLNLFVPLRACDASSLHHPNVVSSCRDNQCIVKNPG